MQTFLFFLSALAFAGCTPFMPSASDADSSTVPQQQQVANGETPDVVVLNLYRDHGTPRGPFFTTDSVAIARYCTSELTKLLLRDYRHSVQYNEVGALDGDPLYNAQDTSITDFAITKEPLYHTPDRAAVVASFRNYDAPQRITFELVRNSDGWRVDDIDWSEGQTLRGILSDEALY